MSRKKPPVQLSLFETCPSCGSQQTYYRRKSNTYACKRCPAVFYLTRAGNPRIIRRRQEGEK